MPIEDWERIVDALDDLEDVFFLEEYRADPEPELLPPEMVDALLSENPIRVWREHRDLSQRQLAELAGISTPYLSQLEAGKREASQRLIRRLAKALRVDVDDLILVEPEAVSGNRARPTEGADGGGAESAARLTRRRGARR